MSTHIYNEINQEKVNEMLKALASTGASVTGEATGPWRVDTNNHGVVLGASWEPTTNVLTVDIKDKDWYVPEGRIWETIDPLVQKIQEEKALV